MIRDILWGLIEAAWVPRRGRAELAAIRHCYNVAYDAHDGIPRKYTGEPYIVHPVALALDAIARGRGSYSVRVLLLHDVIEDTHHTVDSLSRSVGYRVAEGVWALTDQCHDGNRAARKKAEAARLAGESPGTQTRKLIDMMHNTLSIVEHDPGFAVTYLAEKEHLVSVLTGADDDVRGDAEAMIVDARNELRLRQAAGRE